MYFWPPCRGDSSLRNWRRLDWQQQNSERRASQIWLYWPGPVSVHRTLKLQASAEVRPCLLLHVIPGRQMIWILLRLHWERTFPTLHPKHRLGRGEKVARRVFPKVCGCRLGWGWREKAKAFTIIGDGVSHGGGSITRTFLPFVPLFRLIMCLPQIIPHLLMLMMQWDELISYTAWTLTATATETDLSEISLDDLYGWLKRWVANCWSIWHRDQSGSLREFMVILCQHGEKWEAMGSDVGDMT